MGPHLSSSEIIGYVLVSGGGGSELLTPEMCHDTFMVSGVQTDPHLPESTEGVRLVDNQREIVYVK